MTDIQKRFLLYHSDGREKHRPKRNATFFDLISGKGEPKQTKGLAAVFYWNHKFLFDFLNLEAIRQKTGEKFSEKNIAAIDVCAEKYTTDNERADIVISLDGKEGPLLAIIIEAKSIGKKVNTGDLSQQINSKYLEEGKFQDLRNYKKLGVVLTKYTQYISDVACVTWDQIIELLDKQANSVNDLSVNEPDITDQYLDFLTNIGGAMKFYEKEVLSLPAGDTSELIQKHQVYSCRAESGNNKAKKPLFMAFRERGGAMSTLYKLEEKILLDLNAPNALEKLENSGVNPGHIKRIKGYIKDYRQQQGSFSGKDRVFYVFSTDCNIDLPNKPKPSKTITGSTYYTLKEMLEEKILKPKNTEQATQE
jgi:hypothetical protein